MTIVYQLTAKYARSGTAKCCTVIVKRSAVANRTTVVLRINGFLIIDADENVANGDDRYPQYPNSDSVLVGYGHTQLGNCSGPACILNDGRKPIKVALNRKPNDCREVSDCVTITIKTKGRLPWAKQLIESARLRYPRIKCVVADELDANEADYFRSVNILPPGVIYLKTTPGVGFGRKLALMAVETKYALVVDDDFVFTASTNLTKMVDLLERSSADIVGGRVIDHSVFEGISRVADRYESGRYHPTQTSYAGAFFEKVPLFDSCFVCDRVKNFFLADRQVVLAAGSWDESRPFFEHEDFFVQMRRSGVTVVFCRDVVVYHNSTDRQLEVLRLPYLSPMTKHYLHKWGLTAAYECNRNMYTEQTCCDRCKRIGPSVSFDDNSPTIAFDQKVMSSGTYLLKGDQSQTLVLQKLVAIEK